MDSIMINTVITLYAEVLSNLETEDTLMKKLEEFEETFGSEVEDWEDLLRASVRELGKPNVEDAVATIDVYHAKKHPS